MLFTHIHFVFLGFLQTLGLDSRAHTEIMVNNDAVTITLARNTVGSQDVSVSPSLVLRLNVGDEVRCRTSGTWTGNVGGDLSSMQSFFGMILLYVEN